MPEISAVATIVASDENDPAFDAFLLDGIVDNDGLKMDLPEEDFDLALRLYDAEGKLCGGLTAETYYGWMRIKLLFVPLALQGQGQGSRLLKMAEAEARRLACTGIWLDTFSFQAPAFYAARGYALFGVIDAYPETAQRRFMQKRLT